MNGDEITMLLARVQGYDNREVTPQNTLAWAETLGQVPYQYAVQAVQRHFAEAAPPYLTPGLVLSIARQIHTEEQRATATATRQAAEERSEAIRRAALERKAAETGRQLATPEQAEKWGKGALDAVMAAVQAAPRGRNGAVVKGAGVRAGLAALEAYKAKHGPPPLISARRQQCGNPLCHCTHEEPCEGGYIPVDPGNPGADVTPCPICKPKAAMLLDNAKGDRRAAQQLLREQGKAESGADGPRVTRDNAW